MEKKIGEIINLLDVKKKFVRCVLKNNFFFKTPFCLKKPSYRDPLFWKN